MSRDVWTKQLRIAGADTTAVEAALSGDVPADGLQHAGSAILRVERSDALVVIAGRLVDALGERGWTGDGELIADLEHYSSRTTSDLILLPVELDQLGDALDQSGGRTSNLDMVDGTVWPGELFDFNQGPDEFDPDSDRWLAVAGLGSRPGYGDMQRFVASIDHADIAARLDDALVGRSAFRRFQRELSRYEGEYTRWHRFRDDARLGRGRAWLADRGYRSDRKPSRRAILASCWCTAASAARREVIVSVRPRPLADLDRQPVDGDGTGDRRCAGS